MRKYGIIIIILLFLLPSCITTIAHIKKKPDKYQGKKVFVYGRVVSSLELEDMNCFVIKFGKQKIKLSKNVRSKTNNINLKRSNTLFVVTPNYLPLINDRIIVKGIVEKNYSYDKSTMLVIIEDKKKERKIKEPKVVKDRLIKK